MDTHGEGVPYLISETFILRKIGGRSGVPPLGTGVESLWAWRFCSIRRVNKHIVWTNPLLKTLPTTWEESPSSLHGAQVFLMWAPAPSSISTSHFTLPWQRTWVLRGSSQSGTGSSLPPDLARLPHRRLAPFPLRVLQTELRKHQLPER